MKVHSRGRKVSSRRPVVNWLKAEEKGRSDTLFIRELPPGQVRKSR